MDKKMETRTLPITELRLEKQTENNGGIIEGHAAIFDSWSETIGGIFPFRERVKRGAFSESLKNDDIKALFNHDANYVLGRNKAGTLELIEDERGLLVKIKPPETQWAKDLSVSIQRGDINQMSFGFTVEEDDWRNEDGIDVRELRKVKLYDVSPVTYPAYTSTDVGVRGLESYKEYRSKIDADDKALEKSKELEQKKKRQKISNLKTKFRNI